MKNILVICRMLEKRDYELLKLLESNFDHIEMLDKDVMSDIIKALKKENDELKNIKRSPQGEEIIQDDEVVVDDEKYL